MATTMETVFNLLKEVYEPQLQDQLQSETLTLMRIERTSEGVTNEVGGKYVTFPVRVARNHGIGARREMDALPTPRNQDYRAARLNLRYLYGAAQFTGQTFELATNNRQAFASALDQEISGLREGLRKDTNRQVYGSNVGVLATATAAGTTSTFVTTNSQYLEENMWVDAWDESLTPDAILGSGTNVRISDLQKDTPNPGDTTVVLDTTLGAATASGDYLVRNGNKNNEKTGFEDIILGPNSDGTGSLYGIDHSTWTSNVDSTGGNLSEGRMINMVNTIRRRGSMPSVAFCTLGVQTAYFNLLVQHRRYTNTTDFAGGFKGLAFTVDGRDIPIVADFDCQPGRMYFINEKEIKLYQAGDWSFMDRDGSKWLRVQDSLGRYDAYLLDFYKYCEMGTHRRNAHGVLTGITEASV